MARIGIDFGTTNSVMAHVVGVSPQIIPNWRGERLTPSVVAFTEDGEVLVGRAAKNQSVLNPDGTVLSVKRYLGMEHVFNIRGKNYRPEQIAAIILEKLKESAEQYLDEYIEGAVITCPAYFNDLQRKALRDAATIAGLNVMRIINEPTAAALAYGFYRIEEPTKILVYDLGGGTFDVSILEVASGVFEVLSSAGNTHLGGDDMDSRVVDYLLESFRGKHGIDLSEDRFALQKLREEAEKARIELSEASTVRINVPFIYATDSGPLHLDVELTRQQLEEMVSDLLEATREPIFRALDDASLTPEDIDIVILVGGVTRMPAVRKLVSEIFGDEKIKRDLNPDEVVALGASIQAGIIGGDVGKVVLVDITPLTLGVEVEGGLFTPVIKRNTPIPTRVTREFTTVADNQSVVEIHILQGERPIASENVSLGKFELSGIPPAPRGEPRIEVTFEIDENGILTVSAREKKSGKEASVKVESVNLPEEEVKKLVEEARVHREEDRKKVRFLELKNRLRHLQEELSGGLKEEAGSLLQQLNSMRLEDALEALETFLEKAEREIIESGADESEEALPGS